VSNLLDLCTTNSTTSLGPCAEVRVGEHVTRYVRRGSGPAVVVVGADTHASPVWTPLVEWLATSHRVFVPEPPPTADADVSVWLRGFIEGIGVSSIVLIAGDAAFNAALDLATTDDFTVRRLILLTTSKGGQPASDRTLWLLPEWSPTDSLQRTEAFLGETNGSANGGTQAPNASLGIAPTAR
jgi:hypothetical protein